MRRLFRLLLITTYFTMLHSCTDSKILEENTKEIGLSKYKVEYKHLSSDYFKKGTLFEPLYVKDNEFYGLTNLYPYSGTIPDEHKNQKYKLNTDGEFLKYENETVDEYLNDWQVRGSIKDKNIYERGMHIDDINYYYSDFEKDKLKELPWLKSYFEKIKEKKSQIEIKSEKINSLLTSFEDMDFIIYEFNSKVSYDREDDSLKDIPNYKFIYYIDLENEVVYISDVIEEEPSISYYYNYSEKSFIKISKDGTFEKLILENENITFEPFKINLQSILKDYDVTPYNYYTDKRIKDYIVIEFLGEKDLYNTVIIDKESNEVNILKEETFLDKNYIKIRYTFPNSNYFLALYEGKDYIGVINDSLNIELISEIDLKLELYDTVSSYPDIKIFSNQEGDRFLIIVSESNFKKEGENAYNNIQYLLVDIES